MNCMLCTASFEPAEIETGLTDPTKRAAAEAKLRAQQDEGEKWEHVQIVTTRAGGKFELLSGYLCPAENLQPGAVKLSKA